MPGLVGLITNMPREKAEAQLRSMIASVRHESFYDAGVWVDEELGLYLGWVSRGGRSASTRVLSNQTGEVTLILSGQEYSVAENDKARWLDSYAKSGHEALLELNGLFHGVIVDRVRATVTLFNDRYGMHRLYWNDCSDGFFFSVEAKAILAVRPELRCPDAQGIGEFVACSCVLEDRTIFKDIRILPGGSRWVFESGQLKQRSRYFEPTEWESQEALASEDYYSQLRDTFSRALPQYFAGPDRVGMTLTGGLDTRIIMAWHQAAPNALPCYTFGGMFRDCTDVKVARRLAKICKQTHEVITVGSEFLQRFAYYADRAIYLTEGGVDVYRASDLYVSEQAREIAPVKVVGTYGSEIVRHAVMFKAVTPESGLFEGELLDQVEQAKKTYLQLRKQHPVTFAAFRQSPWYHYGILSLEQTHLDVRSPYLDNEFVRTVYRAPRHDGKGEDVRIRMIREGSAELGRIRTDRGVGGDSNALVSAIVRGYQEFTFKAEYAYDYGMPQFVSRIDHFLSSLRLQRLFLGRHKLLHFRVWYRDQLAAYVREMLLDSRTLNRPYLKRASVERIVHEHLDGGLNHTTAIHKLLTLELLHRRFFDPQ